MRAMARGIGLAVAVTAVGCATGDLDAVRWDYADADAGIYFQLPPGWVFLPAASVKEMTSRMTAGAPGAPPVPHFAAIREDTRQLVYPDGLYVFSIPPSNEADERITLAEVCRPLYLQAPVAETPTGGFVRLYAETHEFCAVRPDPALELEGTLYVLVGRAGLIFVMAFEPTRPIETKIHEALERLRIEPR